MSPRLERAQLLIAQERHPQAEEELRAHLAAEPEDAFAHALLGLCLSQQGKLKEGTAEADQAIRLDPESPFSHFIQGMIYLKRERAAEAKKAAEEALRLDASYVSAWRLLAQVHLNEREWKPALEAAEHGLAFDAEDEPCNNLRAMALQKLGRVKEAGQTVDAMLARNPHDAFSHANRGWACLESREVDQAIEHFKEALRLDPDNEFARSGLVEALKAQNWFYRRFLGLRFWMSRLTQRGIWVFVLGGYLLYRLLAAAAENDPALRPYVYPFLGAYLFLCVLSWVGRPISNLLLCLNRLGRLSLSRQELLEVCWVCGWLLMAVSLIVLGFLLDFIRLMVCGALLGFIVMPLSIIFSAAPGGPRRVMIAVTAALTALALIIVALPKAHSDLFTAFGIGIFASGLAANWLGLPAAGVTMDHFERVNTLVTLRRWPQAEEAAREGLKEQPESATLHALLAVALMEQKRFKESRDEVAEAIRLEPEDSYGFYVAALLEIEVERWDAAEDALKEALRLDPTEARSYSRLSWLLARRDDWEGSKKAAQQGLEQDPEHEGCLCRLGVAQWHEGGVAAARATFDEALRRHPESGLVHYLAGLTLANEAERRIWTPASERGAMEHLEQSLRLWPENDESRRKLQEVVVERLQKRIALIGVFGAPAVFLASLATTWNLDPAARNDLQWRLFGPAMALVLTFWALTRLKPVLIGLLRWNRIGAATLTEGQRRDGPIVVGACALILALLAAGLFSARYWALFSVPLVFCGLPLTLAVFGAKGKKLGGPTALFGLGLACALVGVARIMIGENWPTSFSVAVLVLGTATTLFSLERLHSWLWPKRS